MAYGRVKFETCDEIDNLMQPIITVIVTHFFHVHNLGFYFQTFLAVFPILITNFDTVGNDFIPFYVLGDIDRVEDMAPYRFVFQQIIQIVFNIHGNNDVLIVNRFVDCSHKYIGYTSIFQCCISFILVIFRIKLAIGMLGVIITLFNLKSGFLIPTLADFLTDLLTFCHGFN